MLVLRYNPRSTMKKKHHTPEQIVSKLRKVEALTAQGHTVAEAAKQIGVSEQTVYRWKKQYGQMDRNQARRLKQLEKENARLKKLVAELTLDNDILKEALSGKY
jgi:putative transposase